MTAKAWVHLHLPRLTSGDPDMISVKIPPQNVFYTNCVFLEEVEFKVYQPGRKRTLESGQRNVHAWVVGGFSRKSFATPYEPEDLDQIVKGYLAATDMGGRIGKAVYSPFEGPHFVDSRTLAPVMAADRAVCAGKHVFYWNERS